MTTTDFGALCSEALQIGIFGDPQYDCAYD